VLSVYSLFFDKRLECMCVCVREYAHIHTHYMKVLNVSAGVGQTPEELEKSRSTKALYTCRPVYVYKVHLSMYISGCRMMIWANYLFSF